VGERNEIFPWNTNFETGIKTVDLQHRKLVELLNRLVNYIAFEADIPQINKVFDELTEYAAVHFSTEERLWHRYFADDPWEDAHKAEHVDFVEKVREMMANQGVRPLENVLEEISAFLTHWLALHIIESDKRMAKAVLALTSGASPERAKTIANEQMLSASHALIDTVMGMYDQLVQRNIQMSREIHLRAKAEAQLRDAQAKMEALRDAAVSASKAKSEFLANMSHEIRTPLNGVIGMAEVLANENLPPHLTGSMQLIRDSAVNLLGLIDNILDFSKIEAGRLELVPSEFALRDLIANVYQTLQPQVVAKAVAVELSVPADVPDQLWGDPLRIRQILTNIVGNAVKFCNCHVALHVRVAQTTPLLLRIEVIDDGAGMSAETQSRIFAPFVQGESSTTRRFGGTGLGLVITRRLLKLMGGDITVRSVVGEGATFTMTLPLEVRDAPGALGLNENPESADARSVPSVEQARATGRLVLVAEDDPINRKVIGRQLHLLGYACELARDGHEALEMFRRNNYALLITDLLMPVMDGYQLTEAVRHEETSPHHIPIVVLSANAGQGEADRASERGVDRYLVKPILLKDLQAVMQQILPHPPG